MTQPSSTNSIVHADHDYFANEDQSEGWQTVSNNNKKRSISSNHHHASNEKKICPPLAGQLPTANRFQPLENTNVGMEDDQVAPPREPKPPPIFIPDVKNVQSMTRSLEQMVDKSEYVYRVLQQDKIRLLPSTADAYRKIVRGLNDLNVSYYTYQLKQDRAYRVVLKHMHYSTCPDALKEEIESHGHKVRNLSNLKNSVTKQPLSVFFVDLEPGPNNKDIYNIQFLLNAKILFEPPNKKKEVVQCKRCQRLGHTKAYCRYAFRCVKCGQSHETSSCTKDKALPAICALCEGSHTANYKGCPIYKEVQEKQYPPLRNKSLNDSASKSGQRSGPQVQASNHTANNVVVSDSTVSYAQAVQGKIPDVQSNNDSSGESVRLATTIQQSFEKLEAILIKQAEQIGTLLNLLTTVISKIKY